jgi:hypothetical protein
MTLPKNVTAVLAETPAVLKKTAFIFYIQSFS